MVANTAQAAGAAGKPVTDTADALQALGLAGVVAVALTAIAAAAAERQRRRSKQAAALLPHADTAVTQGTQAGLRALSRAAVDISTHADRARKAAERAIAHPQVSPPGEPPGPPDQPVGYAFTDEHGLAQAIALTTTEAAQYHAAEAAGWGWKTWRDVGDKRVRPTHQILGSRTWHSHRVPISTPFESPSGAKIMYPGDPEAPPEEHINCRCSLILTP